MDVGYGSVYHAVFPHALAVFHDLPDHPKGIGKLEVDSGIVPGADCMWDYSVLPVCKCDEALWTRIKKCAMHKKDSSIWSCLFV